MILFLTYSYLQIRQHARKFDCKQQKLPSREEKDSSIGLGQKRKPDSIEAGPTKHQKIDESQVRPWGHTESFLFNPASFIDMIANQTAQIGIVLLKN